MVRIIGIILLTLALAACGGEGGDGKPTISHTTTLGMAVHKPEINELYLCDGTAITNQNDITALLLNWVDIRITEWKEYNSTTINGDYLTEVTERQIYVLIDDYCFPCEHYDGYCGGEYFFNDVIKVAIYDYKDRSYLGGCPNIGLRAIPHELSHAAGFITETH